MSTNTAPAPTRQWWQGASATLVRAFHGYANWLVGISWKRFALLSLLLLILAHMLAEVPPFSWTIGEQVSGAASPPAPPPPPPPGAERRPSIRIERPSGNGDADGVSISIGEHGVHITPRPPAGPSSAAEAAARAASAASAAEQAARIAADAASDVEIRLPPQVDAATREAVRETIEQARRDVLEAIETARDAAEAARRDAEAALRDAERALAAAGSDEPPTARLRVVRAGDGLDELALIWIVGSMILKISYKGRMQAEAQAAQATETAEAESLKRQVVEARLAAMQAQVEPHFLFNTLASIDHLIETDPRRASTMQKHLIALLRASMPTLRETQAGGVRELGRELAVVRPYLEILQMRMEERLQVELCVPAGLLSAEFPPLMLQSLVENAIQHGLEPKPEGGTLRVCAQIVDGRLEVSVADSGVGFGAAGTAGTGVGLANIRERLQLLYGSRAALTVDQTPGGGTTVTVAVPYAARPQQATA